MRDNITGDRKHRVIGHFLVLWILTFIAFSSMASGIWDDGITKKEYYFTESYRFRAQALEHWIITTASVSGGSGGNWSATVTGGWPGNWSTATGTRKSGSTCSEMFPVTLSGDIVPIGGDGPFRTYTYDVRLEFKGLRKIEPETLTVPLGGRAKYTLYQLNADGVYSWRNAYWRTKSPNWASAWSIAPFNVVSYGAATQLPGVFTVQSAMHSDGTAEDGTLQVVEKDMVTADLRVVEVESVKAGTAPDDVTSTTDEPGVDETLYVPIQPGSITVTATPNPDGAWPTHGDPPESYPSWSPTTTPVQNGPSYSHSTASSGKTKITAYCGNYKALYIDVIEIYSIYAEWDDGEDSDNVLSFVEEDLYVPAGISVLLDAESSSFDDLLDDIWPKDNPVWAPGGVIADTVTFTPTEPGFTTVTATCGSSEVAVNIIATDVKIIKLCMLPNHIKPIKYEKDALGIETERLLAYFEDRYLGLSKWRIDANTDADEFACGDIGADVTIECMPAGVTKLLPLKLSLDVSLQQQTLYSGSKPGGTHDIKLTTAANCSIAKYTATADWGYSKSERTDTWMGTKWHGYGNVLGEGIDVKKFLERFDVYKKIAELSGATSYIPESISSLTPNDWGLAVKRDSMLGHDVWCDHDCKVHGHDGGGGKLCEKVSSGYDFVGNVNIDYEKSVNAWELLADALIKATPLNKIPDDLPFDLKGELASFIASKLAEGTGATVDGKLEWKGSANVSYCDHLFYYPCYVFEPFLGDNQDNHHETGSMTIAPSVTLTGDADFTNFWSKTILGHTMLYWYNTVPGLLVGPAPVSLNVEIKIAPKGVLMFSNHTAAVNKTDVNDRPFILQNYKKQTKITGQIYSFAKYTWKDSNGADANSYMYSHIKQDGTVESQNLIESTVSPVMSSMDYIASEKNIYYVSDF